MIIANLDIYRGDTWEYEFTRLGDITGNTEVWLTAKRDKDNADDIADIKVSSVAGLEKINQADPAAAGNGSVTVVNAAVGDVTVRIEAVEMAKLTTWYGDLFYDIQWTDATDTATLQRGRMIMLGDVTRET